MERLTHVVNGNYYPDINNCERPNFRKSINIKLGQLEDIEEELGIDLTTLIKAKKGVYVFIDQSIGIAKYKVVDINLVSQDIAIVFYNEKEDYEEKIMIPFHAYGKTWALTKEELKDE